MRKMVKDRSKTNWHLTWVTPLLIFVLSRQTSLAFAQAPLTLEANNGNVSKQKKSAKLAIFTPPSPVPCPTTNPLRPIIPSQPFPHHTVLLTWKAVADSARIAGYCLYRSENPKIPPTISDCLDCQLVTDRSLTTTGCVDDRVENDKTYYYVVVSAASAILVSRASNEATAKVPKEGNAPPTTSSYPLCRPPESVKTDH
jgi:hypothetical protein